MKKVTVLLTKYSDTFSSVLYYMTGRTYTHASLGVDDVYYSFNYKEFCTETAALHRKRGVEKSILYELNISDKAYGRICDLIRYFKQHRSDFRYSLIGVVCCFLHIPFYRKDHCFCSQFVAEVLRRSDAIDLDRPTVSYLPSHFFHELSGKAQVARVRYDPI